MSFVNKAALFLMAILFVPACLSDAADAVYFNGKIYTQQLKQQWVEAVAVKNGKFIAVGSDKEINKYIGKKTKVTDLNKQFLMPGLHDTHMHTAFAALYGVNLNMSPYQPWDGIVKAIKKYAKETPGKTWIMGGNLPWLTSTIGDFSDIPANKHTLDSIIADRPMIIYDIGGHASIANSLALKMAGITAATLDPEGGTIERDDKGEPTGLLRELAGNLVTEVMPPINQPLYNQGVYDAMQKLYSLGITSITEVWSDKASMNALMALQKSNQLSMRVTAAIGHPMDFATTKVKSEITDMLDHIDRYQGERLKTKYVKYVLDGSAGGQTLVMSSPYEGTDFKGHYRNARDKVISEVTRLHGLGIGSVIHAVGDGAIRTALDAIESAINKHGKNNVRHSIAHTVFVNPADMNRFAELGVNVEFSPYFWWPNEGLDVIRKDIGDRTGWGFPVKELVEQGNHVSAGSDWPVVFDPNPFPAIEALVTRETPGGSKESFGKQFAISLEQALKIYTLGGAYVNYSEDTTGSIEVGKLADFIVLDKNLLDIPVRDIHKIQVLQTVINGELIYKR